MEYQGGDLVIGRNVYMLTQFLLVFVGVLLGIILALTVFMHEDTKSAEYAKEIVESPESFCENGCKYYQVAYESFDDPDDAWKWLDDRHCSKNCPVVEAQIMLFEQREEKK